MYHHSQAYSNFYTTTNDSATTLNSTNSNISTAGAYYHHHQPDLTKKPYMTYAYGNQQLYCQPPSSSNAHFYQECASYDARRPEGFSSNQYRMLILKLWFKQSL